MLNIDRVWSRVAQLDDFRGTKLTDYMFQGITASFALAAAVGSTSNSQPVNFGPRCVLLGAIASAQPVGQAATQAYRPGLDLFTVSIDWQGQQRALVGSTQVLGSCLFGPQGDQFPAKEIIIPVQGGLAYSLTNMTSTQLTVTVCHHCLVPKSAAG